MIFDGLFRKAIAGLEEGSRHALARKDAVGAADMVHAAQMLKMVIAHVPPMPQGAQHIASRNDKVARFLDSMIKEKVK